MAGNKGGAMGFIMFCLLAGLVGSTIWGAIKSKDERAEMAQEFRNAPAQNIFVIIWISAIFMFVIGIFAPILGEKEFFETGLEIWQVAGIATLVGWVITWFWHIR